MSIFLDHNATTPLDERVLGEMMPFLHARVGNPSSLYKSGRVARQAIETAREQVAQLVNAQPSEVIFTSGGTEANNLAIKGLATEIKSLAVSAIEHASVIESAKQLTFNGCSAGIIGVDSEGRVTKSTMAKAMSTKPQLVSVMAANNETGVLQDIPQLVSIAKEKDAVFHTDAAQVAGKLPIDFESLGVNMMTLSSHKIYGPQGVGALIVDRRTKLAPELAGGGQEHGMRSGTENVAAIVGFGKAAELAKQELSERCQHMYAVQRYLEQRLESIDEVVVFAKEAQRLPNTVFFGVKGIEGETLLMALDQVGIEVSSGSACDSKKTEPSHVLLAMGVDDNLARSAIRISVGRDTTISEIDALLMAIRTQLETIKTSSLLAWA